MSLGGLLGCQGGHSASASAGLSGHPLDALKHPHFAPRAKSVIYIHLAGAPSQLELFDYKPELAKLDGQLDFRLVC